MGYAKRLLEMQMDMDDEEEKFELTDEDPEPWSAEMALEYVELVSDEGPSVEMEAEFAAMLMMEERSNEKEKLVVAWRAEVTGSKARQGTQ